MSDKSGKNPDENYGQNANGNVPRKGIGGYTAYNDWNAELPKPATTEPVKATEPAKETPLDKKTWQQFEKRHEGYVRDDVADIDPNERPKGIGH